LEVEEFASLEEIDRYYAWRWSPSGMRNIHEGLAGWTLWVEAGTLEEYEAPRGKVQLIRNSDGFRVRFRDGYLTSKWNRIASDGEALEAARLIRFPVRPGRRPDNARLDRLIREVRQWPGPDAPTQADMAHELGYKDERSVRQIADSFPGKWARLIYVYFTLRRL
jgi:hypothetical protein